MGYYGIYIWPCYLVTLGLLIALVLATWLQHRSILQKIRRKVP